MTNKKQRRREIREQYTGNPNNGIDQILNFVLAWLKVAILLPLVLTTLMVFLFTLKIFGPFFVKMLFG